MTDNSPLIEVKDLYKVFGRQPESVMDQVKSGVSKTDVLANTGHTVGLNHINLKIHAGEIFVIMGLSGSGKSTLIRHFNRLIDPTEGQILVNGEDVMSLNQKELEAFRRQKMSMVFQRFGLLPHRCVLDNALYGLSIQGMSRKEAEQKARHWLKVVGLEGYEDQYPSQLSGGQQQRVGLARALCTDAEILLMDEAFSALDPLIRSEMQDQLIELQKTLHKTIIFITHDLDEALRIGDKIAILKDGELIQQGTPDEILLRPVDDYVEAFVKDVNRARALTVSTVMKPPAARITAETIGEALAQMRRMPQDYGYVFNAQGYQGVVTQEALEECTPEQLISHAATEDTPPIQGCDILEAVIPETLDNEFPLPVLNDQGELEGQLSRSSLATVLGAAH